MGIESRLAGQVIGHSPVDEYRHQLAQRQFAGHEHQAVDLRRVAIGAADA